MSRPLPTGASGAARPRTRRVAAGFLIALLGALLLLAPQASVSIVWRLAVLSFDNPLTQALDELALEQSPFKAPLDELLEATRLAGDAWGRALPPAPASRASAPLASDLAGRAPPLA
jgi:hypothetical protein